MATRALIGYLENGVLTSTYNHYDGYPENLGKALNNFFDSPTLAKDIANYGYISYIDSETGEIEAANSQAPKKLDLNKLDSEQAAEEVAVLVDSFGADYAYFYSPNNDGWDVVKNNGIRSMVEPLEGILSGDFDNTYDEEEMNEAYNIGDNKEVVTKESSEINEDLIAKAEMALKGKADLGDYLESLKNDIRLNGEEGYSDYTTDEDWEEDYFNYTSMNEVFTRQMKYKAGIIK
jgi:hypothetical protein